MSAVFLKLLNMSIAAGWLILAVTALRVVLRRAPRWIICALWAVVAVRLVCPFTFQSVWSLIPSAQTVPAGIEFAQRPEINSGVPWINNAFNPAITEAFAPDVGDSANPLQIVVPVLAALWAAGAAAMLLCALGSYLRLKRSVAASVPLRDNIRLCDEVSTPFLLGVFRPVIYLPSGLDRSELAPVIAHEQAHIRRRDHWWKPLGFLLLSLHWFNPLVWLAYVLLCRDIELACDEKVVRDLDAPSRAAYSRALLDCGIPRRQIAVCPLAFGEVSVRARVKSVLNYRRPAFWLVLAAAAACVVLAVCFLTDPRPVVFDVPEREVSWIEVFDAREADPSARRLGDAQQAEALVRLAAVRGAKRSERYAGLTPFYQMCVALEDGSFLYANGYSGSDRAMTEVIFRGRRYQVDDAVFVRYLDLICSGGGRSEASEALSPGMSFVSSTQPYLSPLSSAFYGGDSGCRYVVGQDSFTLDWRGLREDQVISPVTWGWQDFPWTDEEWAAMCFGTGMEHIHQRYADLRFQPLDGQYSLIWADGALWLAEFRSTVKRLWSIFSLVPERGAVPEDRLIRSEVCIRADRTGTGSGMLPCENMAMLTISSVRHIPICRIRSAEELRNYVRAAAEQFQIDRSYDGAPSFTEYIARYDEAYFRENSLLILGIGASSGSFRYRMTSIAGYHGPRAIVYVEEQRPESFTDDVAFWFMLLEPDSGLLQAVEEWDAVLS